VMKAQLPPAFRKMPSSPLDQMRMNSKNSDHISRDSDDDEVSVVSSVSACTYVHSDDFDPLRKDESPRGYRRWASHQHQSSRRLIMVPVAPGDHHAAKRTPREFISQLPPLQALGPRLNSGPDKSPRVLTPRSFVRTASNTTPTSPMKPITPNTGSSGEAHWPSSLEELRAMTPLDIIPPKSPKSPKYPPPQPSAPFSFSPTSSPKSPVLQAQSSFSTLASSNTPPEPPPTHMASGGGGGDSAQLRCNLPSPKYVQPIGSSSSGGGGSSGGGVLKSSSKSGEEYSGGGILVTKSSSGSGPAEAGFKKKVVTFGEDVFFNS
jgi:hypothetical protein